MLFLYLKSQRMIMSALWNPWHGCHKISEGCKHCYVYRGDARRGIDSTIVTQTKTSMYPSGKREMESTKYHPAQKYIPVSHPTFSTKMQTNGVPKLGE